MKRNQGRQINKPKARPFLRWAGSKKRLLPILSAYSDRAFDRYVEPFAGSSRLFFEIAPRHALLGDINQDLMQTYLEVKYRLPSVLTELKQFRKNRATFKRLRDQEPGNLTRAQRAARFIYLNRYCFNGLYRTNKTGKFNVPYSGEKTGGISSKVLLRECSRILKRAKLIAGDFERTLSQSAPGDFIYMDPPFHASGRRIFKEYNDAGFNENDLKRLRNWLVKLDKMGVKFLVSYAKCKEAKVLSGGFNVRTVVVKRSIAGFGHKRRRSYELLISNFRPAKKKVDGI